MIASTGSDSTNASIMRITGSGVVGITGKTVSGGRLSDSAGTSTLSGNFYMKLFKVGASGEFFVFDTQNSSYLRTTLSHDGFSSWAQLSEGSEFGGYYGAGMRCTYNFADHRLEVKTNPQNSGESAVTTIFGLANGASSPEAQGTSYLYKKTYNAHTHSYSSTVTTAATCAAAGVRTYTCSTCNHTYTETIPKDPTNHTDLCSFAAVPATCTEAGNVAYKYCSGCGNYYNGTGSAQIASSSISVAALGHDYGNWIIDTPATDSSAGRKHKTCSRCGDVQYQTLPATGVLSTTVGSVTATSGSTVSLDVALSCNPGIWAQNFVIYYPEALTLTSVTPLGDVYPAGEAVFSETLNASPASNPVMNALFEGAGISTSGLYGLAYYTDCGDVENTYSNGGILRLSFTLPTKAAGCLESYTVGIFGANTSVGDDAFDADGISLDMTYVPGVISVTDVGVCTTHSWGAVITDTAPSCTAAGSGHKVCSVCGETVSVTIPATGHTHGAWTVTIQATCTEQGQKVQTCTVCGATINAASIPATGHTFSDEWTVDVEPTETTPGVKSRHCIYCDEVTDVTQIEPLNPVLPGDVNGDGKFNSKDLALMKRIVVGTAAEGTYNEANADVNGDGKYTNKDVAALKKIIANG